MRNLKFLSMLTVESTNPVKYNISVHDRNSSKYDSQHKDIFNEYEQNRIRHIICDLIHNRQADNLNVLDFGCGTGNITAHFLALNCHVTAADVSPGNLEVVRSKFKGNPRLSTTLLQSGGLHSLCGKAYDIIYIYSVLHHIPDYLSTLSHLKSLLKPNGIIVVDHEAPDEFWNNQKEYKMQSQELIPLKRSVLKKIKSIANYKYLKLRLMQIFVDSRFQLEGDIHVWPDDHIEWESITQVFSGFTQIVSRDYLVYRPDYSLDRFRVILSLPHICDMRVCAFQAPSSHE